MTKREWLFSGTALLAPAIVLAALLAPLLLVPLTVEGPGWIGPVVITPILLGLLGYWLGTLAYGISRFWTVAGLMTPTSVLLVVYAVNEDYHTAALTQGVATWITGMVLTLTGAALFSSSGRKWAAWLTGIAGSLITAHLAVVVALLPQLRRGTIPGEQIPYLLGQSVISQFFGPHYPNSGKPGDILEIYPYFYLAFAGFAVALAIRLAATSVHK